MKWLLGIACTVFAVAGCSPEDSVDSRSSEVLQSLRPMHVIAGDRGWTMAERMHHYGVPGVGIAVVANGAIEWTGYYGKMDKISQQEVSEKTLFQAASISKPVTALATLQMASDQGWDIRKNVNEYLTSWELEENDYTDTKPVTIAGLLSHTAGISIHGFRGYTISEEVPSLHQILNSSGPANNWVVRPIATPGEQYRYSGGGYCIVQQLLIDQSARPFEELLSEMVLEPLEMTRSTFLQPLPDSLLQHAATGYLPDGRVVEGRRHTYPELAAAGLWTNAADLARFGIALQRSSQQHAVNGLRDGLGSLMTTSELEQAGLGIFLNDTDGEVYFQHGGWNEGFSSQLTFHRDRDYGVVVMINANKPEFIEELIRGTAGVYNWDGYLPPVHQAIEHDEDDILAISGRYKYSDDQVVKIFDRNDTLYLQYLNQSPEEMIKISDSHFVRRNRASYVMFEADTLGTIHLVFKENMSDTSRYDYPSMSEEQKVPFEWVLEGDYTAARKSYHKLEQENPRSQDLNEYYIYNRAEQLVGQKRNKAALALLKINAELRPGSSSAFHRLADMYLELRNEELALRNYKKALKFYPQNEEAKKMIEELENPKAEI